MKNLTIDQMREIVDGAPDWAKLWITRNSYHISCFTFPNMTGQKVYKIDDLRTAIAEHTSKEFEKLYSTSKWALERNPDGSYRYGATQSAFIIFQHQQAEIDKLRKRTDRAVQLLDKLELNTSARAIEILRGEY